MGKIHDQKNHDRGAVCGRDEGLGRLTSNAGDSTRGTGAGESAVAVCAGAGVDSGSNITSGSSRMVGLPGTGGSAERLRAGNSNSAGSPSVHSEEMAAATGPQKNGNLNMTFKMKTLANAIQKGGQGKTFTTCNLAFDGEVRGLRVVVLDLDPQGNASFTLAAHASGLFASQLFTADDSLIPSTFADRDNSGITLIQKDEGLANISKMEVEDAVSTLRSKVQQLSQYFDLCLIDTPPFISNLMVAALFASDYVMSPVEPEPYSIQGMHQMVGVIQQVRSRGNPGLTFLGMLPNRVDSRNGDQLANLAAMRTQFKDLVMPFECRSRKSFAKALGDQIPVWKIPKSAARVAAKEVRVMTQYVFEKMEVVQ